MRGYRLPATSRRWWRRPSTAAAHATLALFFVAALFAASPAVAAFRGANGAVAVASKYADRGGVRATTLVRMAPSGARVRTLARCESNEFDQTPISQPCPAAPDYSADGRRLAFSLNGRLVVADADGSNRVTLPALTSADSEPAFSREGRLAFSGSEGGRFYVFVVNADGTGLRRLTSAGGASPAWSSRGLIAYARAGTIRLVRPDGSADRRLAAGRAPDWSPSGRSLVYEHKRRLYTLAAKRGARRRPLVRRWASEPVFSPDGRRVLFVRTGRFSRSALWTVAVRGGRARVVIDGGDEGTSETTDFGDPSWQPLPRRWRHASSAVAWQYCAARHLSQIRGSSDFGDAGCLRPRWRSEKRLRSNHDAKPGPAREHRTQ